MEELEVLAKAKRDHAMRLLGAFRELRFRDKLKNRDERIPTALFLDLVNFLESFQDLDT